MESCVSFLWLGEVWEMHEVSHVSQHVLEVKNTSVKESLRPNGGGLSMWSLYDFFGDSSVLPQSKIMHVGLIGLET